MLSASVYASTLWRCGRRGNVLPNVALRIVRVSVLLVLPRHCGDGGCKLGEIAGGANRMSDDKTEGLPALRQGGGGEDRADRGNANRRAAIKESWVADRGNDDRRAAIKGVYLCVCVWRMLM